MQSQMTPLRGRGQKTGVIQALPPPGAPGPSRRPPDDIVLIHIKVNCRQHGQHKAELGPEHREGLRSRGHGPSIPGRTLSDCDLA